MLYGINSSVSTEQQNKYDVRAQLMKLGKKYRKIDRNMKTGLKDMSQNFVYYLNEGASIDDLIFYFDHHRKETESLLAQWENADPKFAKILRGRKLVLAEIEKAFTGEVIQ